MKSVWKILILIVIMLGVGFGYSRWRVKEDDKSAFREQKVERSDIATTILATGTVQPENRLEIKPPIAGRSEQVLVEEGQHVRKGQILAWISSTERAALLDAARAEGAAEVERWSKLYKPTPVVAPIAGMIIARNVESGQTFANTDAILVMSDRLTVKAQVDETDIAQIKLKQPTHIVLDAYPGQVIPGKVDQIAYDAKTVSNVTTYTVDVLPDAAPEFMRSGMTANVTFLNDEHENVIVISAEALKTENGVTRVSVKDADGQVQLRTVSVGLSDGKRVEVISGLQEGETVLVPVFALKGKSQNGSSPFTPFNRRPRTNAGGK